MGNSVKLDKGLNLFARLLFVGLILFELFNEIGLLNFALDFTWFGLAITSLGVWFILELASFCLRKKCGMAMPGWILFLAVIAVYLDAFGDIFKFYSQFARYDQAMHFLASAAAMLVAFGFINQLVKTGKINLKLKGQGVLSVLITSFAGVLYEIEEYLEDYFRGTNRLGDGPDTANDLMMNLFGAILIFVMIMLINKCNERQRNRKIS